MKHDQHCEMDCAYHIQSPVAHYFIIKLTSPNL